jgi:hypothetical protein
MTTDSNTGNTEPDELHERAAEMYRQKNEDYGESWKLAGETLSQWCEELDVESVPTDRESMISLGLFFQRFHKLTRAFNGEFAQDELNHESVFDSHHDEATYAEMHASLFTGSDDGSDDAIDNSDDSDADTDVESVSGGYRKRGRHSMSDHKCDHISGGPSRNPFGVTD